MGQGVLSGVMQGVRMMQYACAFMVTGTDKVCMVQSACGFIAAIDKVCMVQYTFAFKTVVTDNMCMIKYTHTWSRGSPCTWRGGGGRLSDSTRALRDR